MMYYNGDIYISDDKAFALGEATLRLLSYFPVRYEKGEYVFPIERLAIQPSEFNGSDAYVQRYIAVTNDTAELGHLMPTLIQNMQERYARALGEIDYRCSRATQDITARNAEIAAIDESLTKVTGQAAEELSLLRAELHKSNASDGRILVEMRQIAESNRTEQTELLALEITEDMTLEEAQEITLRIANAQPWLPWRE